MGNVALVLLLLVGSLGAQAFFSGSEMAMVSADRLTLHARAREGNIGAALALRLLQSEAALLATCLIGTNLCIVANTTLVATMLSWGGIELGLLSVLILTPIALIFAEALPKTVMQHHANTLAPWVAWPLRGAQIVFFPALWVVTHWSHALERLTGKRNTEPVTRQDIVALLQDGKPTRIDPDDKRLIRRVFAMSDARAVDLMTPLVRVAAVSIEATVREATEVASKTGHSRIPVYKERVDQLVGTVHAQDLLFQPDAEASISNLVVDVDYVPESKTANDLFGQMRSERSRMMIVVDEYGGAVGIITVEDVLEELVGDIRDEREKREPAIIRLAEREWRVPGRATVERVQEAVGVPLPAGDFESIAGLLLHHIGRIPEKGEEVRVGQMVFVIEDASPRAILVVRVTIVWQTPQGAPGR